MRLSEFPFSLELLIGRKIIQHPLLGNPKWLYTIREIGEHGIILVLNDRQDECWLPCSLFKWFEVLDE